MLRRNDREPHLPARRLSCIITGARLQFEERMEIVVH